jgi:8-amino-7-oxononanoate synthase
LIDLTRALYLGFAHPHAALAPWSALTPGRPAVLGGQPGTHALARRLACLLGLPRATLAPSTLHVVTDLYGALPERVRQIHVHACSYEITRWGLERARLRGVAIRSFRTLRELVAQLDTPGDRAIVCDAVCVACRRISPLRRLQQLAARTGGWLIVDDSQGLGLLGERPSRAMPYGRGGGGSLRWSAARPERVVVIGSCAKAFGAPLAFLAGTNAFVDWFERTSGTRTHASPCHAAGLAALAAALRQNDHTGDELRSSLVDRVRVFRAAVTRRGGALSAGAFPVQVTSPLRPVLARAIEDRLARSGVRALRMRAGGDHSRLGFVVTALHDPAQLVAAGGIVGDELTETTRWSRRGGWR